MISAVNGRKRALLTKSALEWHNKRCTAQSTLCVGNKKGKTELKAMCGFIKKKKKYFSIAILGSRYDTRIAGPSIAMHRCIDASLRPYTACHDVRQYRRQVLLDQALTLVGRRIANIVRRHGAIYNYILVSFAQVGSQARQCFVRDTECVIKPSKQDFVLDRVECA